MKREIGTEEFMIRIVDDAYKTRINGGNISGTEKSYSELERSGKRLDVVAKKFMKRGRDFYEAGVIIPIGIDIEPREALKRLSNHCRSGIINLENYIIFVSYNEDKNAARTP